MDTGRISARYAKAAYEVALQKGEETRLYEEMKILSDNFSSFKSLHKVMEDPTVAVEEKKKLLITAGGISVSDSYKSLIDLIAENKREPYARFIALMYLSYYRKEKSIVIGRLITAQPATVETENRLRELITRNAKIEVDFISKINPDIIGGFILELESNQLDASVKTQLNKLRMQLIEINKDIA